MWGHHHHHHHGRREERAFIAGEMAAAGAMAAATAFGGFVQPPPQTFVVQQPYMQQYPPQQQGYYPPPQQPYLSPQAQMVVDRLGQIEFQLGQLRQYAGYNGGPIIDRVFMEIENLRRQVGMGMGFNPQATEYSILQIERDIVGLEQFVGHHTRHHLETVRRELDWLRQQLIQANSSCSLM
eukprot:TRINITY_DN189_c0_g3_i1.p1 TRINITY_DN189_c0_g3~~TRINITY_DN189_c0_g3_i1.p1  ORF type:complete len:181 (-),score=29.32 TRINITY_DN189_c0_g3_i1:210-752(-)